MTATSVSPSVSPLARPVTSLPGVGSERAALLSKLEVRTVEDLLLYRPRRYEDRQNLYKIVDLRLREPSITHGTIVALGTKWFRHHTKSIFEIILDDGTGRLHCRWWNLPFMEKYFALGNEVLVFGKPLQLKPRTIDHPETEVLEGGEESFIHLNRITPVYALTEGLGQRWLRALIWRTLQSCEPHLGEGWAETHKPKLTSCGTELPSRAQAIQQTHFPETHEQIEAARKRLALDEFVDLQCRIQSRRKNFEDKSEGLPCAGDNHLMKPFLGALGFKLTEAQTKVLRELRRDMSGEHPMRRLLQGDVGCGKTLVAACNSLMAMESGFNVALMAPTEILAEQHFANFCKWFHPLGIVVELRTGARKDSADVVSGTGSQPVTNTNDPDHGRPKIFIGTHALIQSGFTADNLGLVIIDEQHKFGVTQREQLLKKGNYPHLLVMTATPIPRTLGLTLYGDLDVSVIDQLPPGRGTIKTFVRRQEQLDKVWEFMRCKMKQGRQAYVVYPHIEENGQSGLKTVMGECENLKRSLAPYSVGVVHGRLRSDERERVMTAFKQGKLQVLLATSVIEVGVDVANATMMVVQHAEQFGLAQLHQLRGRIGRGAHHSFCILIAEAKNKVAQERLRVLEETTDGFRIAEADLKLRGPGELLGQQQSGLPRLRFGDLTTDLPLIHQAREVAAQLVRNPPSERSS